MSGISARPADRYARLLSVGGFRPSRVVTNEEMCTMVDSTPEWIEQRTGIVERRWCTPEETLEVMALEASRRALERSGLQPSHIDVVLLASVSHYRQFPALAPQLATKLGIDGPGAFDIGAGCAGFCHGLALADSLVRTRQAEHVLVIGAERLSDITDVTDRGTAFLLADGAGAVVVGPSEAPGIGPVVWGSDGSQSSVIEQRTTWQDAVATSDWPWITMQGNKVFRWAITAIAERAAQAISAAGMTPKDLDVFIPHQANNRIIDSMLKHLTLDEHTVIARDIRHLGNTSSASIPLAMDSLLSSGQARSGQTALTIGFGAGLVYAGQVVVLP